MSRQLSALLLFAFSGTALAQTAGSPASDGSAATKPEKKICRSIEVTGSIMHKSTCHTKTDWAAIDSANSEAAHNALDLSNRSGRPPGNF